MVFWFSFWKVFLLPKCRTLTKWVEPKVEAAAFDFV